MQVGDMVRFTDEHSSRPGYDYCADWTGIIFQYPDDFSDTYRIYWRTQQGTHVGEWKLSDGWRGLEVISESR